MAASIYLRRDPIKLGSHDVKCEVRGFRNTLTRGQEVLLKMSSTWLGEQDYISDEFWVSLGETFTVSKDILVS